MSFKPEVIADSSGKWAGNGLAFATEAEALAYAKDLAGRWTLVTDWRVVESTELVNARWADGKMQRISLDPWKEAVLDHLVVCCLDAPQDEPPYKIIGRIIDWHVAVATDPAVNGGFKLVPVDGVQASPAPLSDAQIEALLPKVRHRPGMIGYACYSFGEVAATVRAALGVKGSEHD